MTENVIKFLLLLVCLSCPYYTLRYVINVLKEKVLYFRLIIGTRFLIFGQETQKCAFLTSLANYVAGFDHKITPEAGFLEAKNKNRQMKQKSRNRYKATSPRFLSWLRGRHPGSGTHRA